MEAQQMVPIYFQLPEDLDRGLRRLARREDRTLAAQLRHLIREAVRQEPQRESTRRPEGVTA